MSPFSLLLSSFWGMQRILGYVRPRRIVAVHPPETGSRRSLWRSFRLGQTSDAPLEDSEPEWRHSICDMSCFWVLYHRVFFCKLRPGVVSLPGLRLALPPLWLSWLLSAVSDPPPRRIWFLCFLFLWFSQLTCVQLVVTSVVAPCVFKTSPSVSVTLSALFPHDGPGPPARRPRCSSGLFWICCSCVFFPPQCPCSTLSLLLLVIIRHTSMHEHILQLLIH